MNRDYEDSVPEDEIEVEKEIEIGISDRYAVGEKIDDDAEDLEEDGSSAGEKYAEVSSDDDDASSDYEESSNLCVKLASDLLFVLGSLLYVILAFDPIDYYQWSGSLSIPQDVVDTKTDDAFWWAWYDENGLIPEDVYNADDDVTLYDWYENSFPDEGHVFDVGNTYVTRYMILYFSAAMCFFLVGIMSFWVWRHWFALVMVVAALFGIASSLFVVENERLAIIFNSVSVHLFAFEAIYLLVFFRRQQQVDDDNMDLATKHVIEDSQRALMLGDIFFVIGTLGDLILSYFSLVGTFRLPHAYAAIAAAACWFICSCVYLLVTSVEIMRSRAERNDEYDDGQEYMTNGQQTAISPDTVPTVEKEDGSE
uniref:Uncharacterized protein n=1 Tax=Grammatophora oceanica TaxID=210454 RepID=A0A6U5HFX6_9STRA|mmetsp:Transcript_1752/g.2361  ORF Transcript_1752/g.2361 Transcript_1752/m.2361 type:complete len:367 (+) Transcript_1752:178-1278(+)|eukprot:CAMPEP_0194033506 /NCGR_PEP_ID=MMETSP0009_2-20130614/6178_1 /TAXON_ID=210454 /ORGANISM="Grammatophora oceanica, Strain CCMP 410" /LENGTH=366 /DNA_ID=CAMNT_0038674215 /DNA_START=166 /DNA_END=1266 /DNA_ORIENTATION=+